MSTQMAVILIQLPPVFNDHACHRVAEYPVRIDDRNGILVRGPAERLKGWILASHEVGKPRRDFLW